MYAEVKEIKEKLNVIMLRILSMSHNELRIGKREKESPVWGWSLFTFKVGFTINEHCCHISTNFFLWVANRWCHVAVEGRFENEWVKLLAYPFSTFCKWQIDNFSLEEVRKSVDMTSTIAVTWFTNNQFIPRPDCESQRVEK